MEFSELYHHGILGMKWGVRRYQNYDGSLTAAGRRHLDENDRKFNRVTRKAALKSAGLTAAQIAGPTVAGAVTARAVKKLSQKNREEGAREDAAEYRHNKSGESGWQGAKRSGKEIVTKMFLRDVLDVSVSGIKRKADDWEYTTAESRSKQIRGARKVANILERYGNAYIGSL